MAIASLAAQMGASTVLIERGLMGGNRLNTGCVPSHALIAAAEAAYGIRKAAQFGIAVSGAKTDFAAVNAHVKDIASKLAPNDSVERLRAQGVQIIPAVARFKDRRTVLAGDLEFRCRAIVIATGARHGAVDPGSCGYSLLHA